MGIEEIINQIVSIIFPQIVEDRKEEHERNRRIQLATTNLLKIMEAEKENIYYHSLERVISESNIIQDSINRLEVGRPSFNLWERLKSVFDRLRTPIEEREAIAGVITKMLKCLKSIMLEPASSEEARSAARFEELNATVQDLSLSLKQNNAQQNKEPPILSLNEIESHCEVVRNVSDLIPRKWVAADDADDAGSIEVSKTLLQREKHIVLVNRAGFGKTIALHQLYAESKSSGRCAVLLTLNRYSRIPLFHDILTKVIPDAEKIILLLDGYDEVKTECRGQLDDELNKIVERYPQITIVISSRENFFEKNDIKHFKLYRLAKLTDHDRRQYAQRKGIAVEVFMEQIQSKNLSQISENAFYFAELIHLWQQNNSLPDEAHIMEKIIESRIQADNQKFMFSAPELEERESLLLRSFERIAMIMQCIQRYSLTEDEVRQIVGEDLCGDINLHGIWETEDAKQLFFSHNNFREYFAALWLNRQSLEEILFYIVGRTEKQKIRPSWINVFAYLAKLRNKRDLQDWITEHDPEAVIAFEKERFSAQDRLCLFTRMYDTFEEKQWWVTMDYPSLLKMGAFVSSQAAVDYILNKLSSNIENRQKQNLLRIMEHFDSLYAEQNECNRIVSSIAFDHDLPSFTRNDALDVMQAFPTVFSEHVSKAAQICMDSAEEDYRNHLCRFIDAAGELENNFQLILHELEQPDNIDGHFNGSRSIFLGKRIASLQSPQAVADLMIFSIRHPAIIHDRMPRIDWSHLFNVAIANYKRKEYDFLSLAKQLFLICHQRFIPNVINEIKRYMVATHTEKAFLDFIQSHDELQNLHAVQELMCPSFCDTLIFDYGRNALNDPELLKNIVISYPKEDDICRKLQRAIYLKTGNFITPWSYQNQESLRIEGKQRCFDALFSRSKFLELVKKLGLTIGMEHPINDHIILKIIDEEELLECYYILHNCFEKDDNVTIADASEQIRNWDWDWFQYCMVSNRIDVEADIKLSASQNEWMKTYTLHQLESIDLKKTAKLFAEQQKFEPSVRRVLSTMVKLNMNSSLEILKELLLVPTFLLGEDNLCAFSPYLINHIPQEEMHKLVITNILQEDLRDCVAAAHLEYCTEHKLPGAKAFAIQFMCRKDGKGYRYFALHYISEICGPEAIINEVVPLCNDDDFLREIVHFVPEEIRAPLLDEKLDAAYARNPSQDWMQILIKRNHYNALKQYLREAESKNKLPDMSEGMQIPLLTEAIEYVSDVALLDMILKLLYLTTTPGFVDRESFGLSYSCGKSVRRMANTSYDVVRSKLEQEKKNASSEYRQLCIDLIQQINEDHQNIDDKGISFPEALILINA